MLKLLLDEHISAEIAAWLRRRDKNISVTSLTEWEVGAFIGLPDDALLKEALKKKLTLVSYDRRTIPPLLKQWAEEGRDHGGVIFVDEKTILPSDFGGLIHALYELVQNSTRWDWTNRICFLRRSKITED